MASVMRMTSTIGCRGLLTGDDGNAQAKRVCVALANLSGRHTLIERVYWLNEALSAVEAATVVATRPARWGTYQPLKG